MIPDLVIIITIYCSIRIAETFWERRENTNRPGDLAGWFFICLFGLIGIWFFCYLAIASSLHMPSASSLP